MTSYLQLCAQCWTIWLMAAKSINIDGTHYALEFFLGGGLKVQVMLPINVFFID